MISLQKAAASFTIAAGIACGLAAPASAQKYPAYAPPPPPPGYYGQYGTGGHPHHKQMSVKRRLKDQQRMIDQGARNGSLSGHQQALLQARLNYVRQQEAMYRAKHGGKLTPEERRKLESVLNHDSGAIKHDYTH